jgi:hypothetical protein
MNKARRLLVVAVVAVAAVFGSVASASQRHSLDNCSSNNGNVACKYLDQGSLNSGSGILGMSSDYWVTSSMWRPAGYCAQVGFYNSSGLHYGPADCSSDTHFSYYGPFGYSRGACANGSFSTINNVTCEVFNWTV